MSERGFGIVSGRSAKDWAVWEQWQDGSGMLPRKDGLALLRTADTPSPVVRPPLPLVFSHHRRRRAHDRRDAQRVQHQRK